MKLGTVTLALSIGLLVAPAGMAQVHRADAQAVQFAVPNAGPHSPALTGYLRRPSGQGAFPAVVVLHGCGGGAVKLDETWGARLQRWGYVALTVDSFGARGIRSACKGNSPVRLMDAYGALAFLARQTFVDAGRVAVMGFSQGGINALWDVERGGIEQKFRHKFRAAIAFYPLCTESGAFTVPTLVINGELDDWSPADACRKMVAQESDIGRTRTKTPTAPVQLVVLPNAFHGFAYPWLQPGRRYLGHWLEYNRVAAEQAAGDVHAFLGAELGH